MAGYAVVAEVKEGSVRKVTLEMLPDLTVPDIDRLIVTTRKGDGYRLRGFLEAG